MDTLVYGFKCNFLFRLIKCLVCREAVDLEEHPDYLHMVKVPMDLATVRENLEQKKYNTPVEFCKDMRLIFSNSKNYNTNKRSRVSSLRLVVPLSTISRRKYLNLNPLIPARLFSVISLFIPKEILHLIKVKTQPRFNPDLNINASYI